MRRVRPLEPTAQCPFDAEHLGFFLVPASVAQRTDGWRSVAPVVQLESGRELSQSNRKAHNSWGESQRYPSAALRRRLGPGRDAWEPPPIQAPCEAGPRDQPGRPGDELAPGTLNSIGQQAGFKTGVRHGRPAGGASRPASRRLTVRSGVEGTSAVPYQLLADAVLVVHFAVVVFVVGGLVLVVTGSRLGWLWVDGWWFRLAHLGAIAFVAAQAWLGELCPLTTLESWLRVRAGASGYTRSFIEHWLQRIIFYEAPSWLFALAYTLFAALVLAGWWYFPPTRNKGSRNDA